MALPVRNPASLIRDLRSGVGGTQLRPPTADSRNEQQLSRAPGDELRNLCARPASMGGVSSKNQPRAANTWGELCPWRI